MSKSRLEPGQAVVKRALQAGHPETGRLFDGLVFTGPGRGVVGAIAGETGMSRIVVLEEIVQRLLVRKGVDWTTTIVGEYLGLHGDSSALFTVVWDRRARQLVAHGAVFQSVTNPGTGLLAHIRTAEGWNGLGLGTLVTAETTRAAFQRGAELVCLATDDKRHRLQQGERAAHRMYASVGYTILATQELADTVDWLMVIDRQIFERQQAARQGGSGRFPREAPAEVQALQAKLVAETRSRFSEPLMGARIQPVGDGDMAGVG